ncbi:STYKc [Seminavis robusta]|uniref:STYKc n=1 Tax=Seminavis robusta TaxID=568900 RepID=A0A9N8EX08_9STRA|nr:STYKc [Seminavis robusta]|eukprot:Sro1854_g301860.1 STYKc (242) ;mRNA; r:7989-9112
MSLSFSSTRNGSFLLLVVLLVIPSPAAGMWPPQIGWFCPGLVEPLLCVGNRADYWIESTCLAENTTSMQVLADFYFLTGNTYKTGALFDLGWLDDCDYCNWAGVTCNGLGEVTGLDVGGMDPPLVNKIPTELAFLQNSLKTLILSANEFEGKVPTELGLLYNLERMELHYNDLKGSMPEEVCLIGGFNGGGSKVYVSADCGRPDREFKCQMWTCCDACYLDSMRGMDPVEAAMLAQGGISP